MSRGRVALTAAFVLLCACNPQPDRREPAPSPSSSVAGLPPLEITGHGTQSQPVTASSQSGNRKTYRLVAASYVSHSAKSVQTNFQQAAVTFYDKDGTRLEAQSPQASIEQSGKRVVLSGGVRARTSTGLNLTCDRLTYEQNTGLVHGEGHVRIWGLQGGQQEVLTGTTFTSDVKLTQMVLK